MYIKQQAALVKAAAPILAGTSRYQRNNALQMIAKVLEKQKEEIFAANKKDLEQAEKDGVAAPIIKRLKFDENKLKDVLSGIESLIGLDDPLFKIDLKRQLNEGLTLYRETCPIGVIGVIFEARPDALIQISSLCIKSGNCVILKGGSETMNSNKVLFNIIYNAVLEAGMPENCMLQLEARSEISELLSCNEYVDLLIPRGSNSFVQYIMNNTKIPVMGHADGICHVYVDNDADFEKAIPIIIDSKTQYVSACNAVETLLIHKDIINEFVPKLHKALQKHHVELRGSEKIVELTGCNASEEADNKRESWAAAVNSYVPAGSSMSGFEMFVRTIPFNLYAMLTLYMVFFTSLLGFDFGLMKKHERNAAHGDLFTSGGEAFQNQEIKDPTEGGKFAKGKVIDLIAPMIVMIFTAIATMIWTGYLNGGTNLVEDFANCSSSESLVFAGLVTVGFLLLFYLPRRVIGFKDFMNSVPEGGKLMMPPILILVLAWTLKGMTDALGIGDFVRQAVSLNAGLMRFVPLLIFCIAIFIAFSSGTSWGTFAILVPIVVNMFSETDPTMMIVAVSAVLAGAVCGDHISPISDTTIMSSSGAQSNHINHVQTQMQYAMVVVAACVPGYLIAGFTENWLITLVSSLAILTAALLYLRRRSLAEDARA